MPLDFEATAHAVTSTLGVTGICPKADLTISNGDIIYARGDRNLPKGKSDHF
jgi:hypothetical protein